MKMPNVASTGCSLIVRDGPAAVVPAIFGHNQINGPIYQIPYDDPELAVAAQALWTGQLRFPGGTVANYWHIPNATYVEPCAGKAPLPAKEPICQDYYADTPLEDGRSWGYYTYGCTVKANGTCYTDERFCTAEGGVWLASGYCGASSLGISCGCCGDPNVVDPDPDGPCVPKDGIPCPDGPDDYDYCKRKEPVDEMGPNIFTATAFNSGVGTASPVADARGTLYGLNVLTEDTEGIIAQIDALRSEADAGGFQVNFLEFGNELFMKHAYEHWFADAREYMTKVEPALQHARRVFPRAKLAVPFGFPFCSGSADEFDQDWNSRLAAHNSSFDAVTIHDYSACTKSVDDGASHGGWAYAVEDRRSALAAWGEVQILKHTEAVQAQLSDVDIWMTEWGYASWVGVPLQDEPDWSEDGVSTSAITGIFHASFLLAMASHSGESVSHTAAHHHLFNEWTEAGWGRNAGAVKVGPDGALIAGAGQIFSHVAYVALRLSDSLRAVDTASCEGLSFSVQGKSGLSCLYATAFEHSCRKGAQPVFVVINRCSHTVEAEIATSTVAAGTVMRAVSYDSYDKGSWTPLSALAGFDHPWSDGPLSPSVSFAVVQAASVPVAFAGVSLTVVEFAEARSAAAGCPKIEFECVQCTDEPTDNMVQNGTACTTWTWGLQNKCSKDAGWATSGTCRRSCFLAGSGYAGDNCCPVVV